MRTYLTTAASTVITYSQRVDTSGRLSTAKKDLTTVTLPKGVRFGFDETALNGQVIEQQLVAAGAVRVE